jgi:hypothetical protein
MVLMALNMLGVLPGLRRLMPRLPAPLARLTSSSVANGKSPLILGLLGGLMPCGPLQAMQLYALSTASPIDGALSMLAFALGTMPLMFGLGLLSSLLTERFTKKLMVVGASLVMLLGLFMFSNGWTLSDFPAPPNPAVAVVSVLGEGLANSSATQSGSAGGGSQQGATGGSNAQQSNGSQQGNGTGSSTKNVGVIEGDRQVVTSTLSSSRYPAITVTAGTPVRWEIEAPSGSITGCNNRMRIPEYKIEYQFKTGTNVIEFTPTKTGTFRYSCWMGMVSSTITVV